MELFTLKRGAVAPPLHLHLPLALVSADLLYAALRTYYLLWLRDRLTRFFGSFLGLVGQIKTKRVTATGLKFFQIILPFFIVLLLSVAVYVRTSLINTFNRGD
jgi:hypothetical protein